MRSISEEDEKGKSKTSAYWLSSALCLDLGRSKARKSSSGNNNNGAEDSIFNTPADWHEGSSCSRGEPTTGGHGFGRRVQDQSHAHLFFCSSIYVFIHSLRTTKLDHGITNCPFPDHRPSRSRSRGENKGKNKGSRPQILLLSPFTPFPVFPIRRLALCVFHSWG